MVNEYLDRIQAAKALFPVGDVTVVTIEHGPSCQHAQARWLPCSCFPLVVAVVNGEALTIGTGGAILDRRKVQ